MHADTACPKETAVSHHRLHRLPIASPAVPGCQHPARRALTRYVVLVNAACLPAFTSAGPYAFTCSVPFGLVVSFRPIALCSTSLRCVPLCFHFILLSFAFHLPFVFACPAPPRPSPLGKPYRILPSRPSPPDFLVAGKFTQARLTLCAWECSGIPLYVWRGINGCTSGKPRLNTNCRPAGIRPLPPTPTPTATSKQRQHRHPTPTQHCIHRQAHSPANACIMPSHSPLAHALFT